MRERTVVETVKNTVEYDTTCTDWLASDTGTLTGKLWLEYYCTIRLINISLYTAICDRRHGTSATPIGLIEDYCCVYDWADTTPTWLF